MNRNAVIAGILFAVALGGGVLYRSNSSRSVEKKDVLEAHQKPGSVTIGIKKQAENGVTVAVAKKQPLRMVINVTGKVAVNADGMAHVSPHIQGKISAVKVSLGDSVSGGQPLAVIESVELGDALSRYFQSKSKFALAQSSMERIKSLVEKKIAARKELLQAESELMIVQTEFQANKERLALYGVSQSDLTTVNFKKPHLIVRSPISGIITEKHAVVGELSDPSKSLFTIVDLSSV